jgi:hypothetical protein
MLKVARLCLVLIYHRKLRVDDKEIKDLNSTSNIILTIVFFLKKNINVILAKLKILQALLYIDKLDAEIRVSRTAELCVWNHIQMSFTVWKLQVPRRQCLALP